MARELIQRYADYDVLSVAPNTFDYTTDTCKVVNDSSGASASFKVYDPTIDEAISSSHTTGQTIINVSNIGVFSVDDSIEITLDDDAVHIANINSLSLSNSSITMSAGLPSGAAAGNRIRKIFGVSISMTEFGTANLNTRNWGYRGVLLGSHVAHSDIRAKDSLDVTIEIRVIESGGAVSFDTICASIQETPDCG